MIDLTHKKILLSLYSSFTKAIEVRTYYIIKRVDSRNVYFNLVKRPRSCVWVSSFNHAKTTEQVILGTFPKVTQNQK